MDTTITYVKEYEYFHKAHASAVFSMLCATLLATILLYGYFLKSAAFSVARWENDQHSLLALSSEVSELEAAYLKRIETLGMNEARAMGLSETKTAAFIERGSDTRLTLSGPGSDAAR